GAMIRVSLRLGGLVASAPPEHLDALDTYGEHLGLAFQITDDLLDARGSESATGKRVGKDAERGKLTFPRLLGLDQSASRARELVDDACRSILPLGGSAEGLEAVARYVLERNH
ncbi:MAG: polyprenyl synthetase family protein, partial [Planctomycetota bacterium]